MGYYADTTWNITFHTPEAEQAAYTELRAELGWTIDDDTWMLCNIGEEAEQHRDGLNLSGWTGGKYSYNADKGIVIIAKYADGEVELDASDSGDGYGKYVLSDGTARWVHGYIAYRDDEAQETLDQGVIVTLDSGLICSVKTPAGKNVPTTVHDYDVDGVDEEDLIHDPEGNPYTEWTVHAPDGDDEALKTRTDARRVLGLIENNADGISSDDQIEMLLAALRSVLGTGGSTDGNND